MEINTITNSQTVDDSVVVPGAPDPNTPDNTPGDGNQTPGKDKWVYQLEKDLQEEDRIVSMGGVSKLARTYLETVGKIENMVELPGEKADAEAINTFYGKLGRPEKAEAYDFTGVDKVDLVKDEEILGFKQKCHNLGLNQKQAKELYQSSMSDLAAQQKANKEARVKRDAEWEAELKKDFGDKYNSKIEQATRAFAEVGGKEVAELFESVGMAQHPNLIKGFVKIYEQLGGDRFFTGSSNPGGSEGDGWYPNTDFGE